MDEATRKAWEASPFGRVHRQAVEAEARREAENAQRRTRWWDDALMWAESGTDRSDPTERAALAHIREQCPNHIFGEAQALREVKKVFRKYFRGVDWDWMEKLQATPTPKPAPQQLRLM